MSENKNYGIGRYVSLWYNEGKDGKRGFYTITIRRMYKDKDGVDCEQKISMFADDALRLEAELRRANAMLLSPREIIKQEPIAAPATDDDIPF